jgi:hypothetical protein
VQPEALLHRIQLLVQRVDERSGHATQETRVGQFPEPDEVRAQRLLIRLLVRRLARFLWLIERLDVVVGELVLEPFELINLLIRREIAVALERRNGKPVLVRVPGEHFKDAVVRVLLLVIVILNPRQIGPPEIPGQDSGKNHYRLRCRKLAIGNY